MLPARYDDDDDDECICACIGWKESKVNVVGWAICHINPCRLSNAESIFLQIICSISNNLF